MANANNDLNKITNLHYLMDLSKGNKQFVKEMIDTFLVENPKEIQSLESAIRKKDFENIRQTAHLLQSSIPFVGLDKIIELEVYEIEKLATDKTALEKIGLLFSKVKKTCEMAQLELKENRISST